MKNTAQAFTFKIDGIVHRLITPAFVGQSIDPATKSLTFRKDQVEQVNALWDTGATACCISERLAKKLKLEIIDTTSVTHAKGKSDNVPVYLGTILLLNKIAFPNQRIVQFVPQNNFDLIIGMNLIINGDFSITNVGGKTTFSFRLPSQETIDYVKIINSDNKPFGEKRDEALKKIKTSNKKLRPPKIKRPKNLGRRRKP